MISHLISPSSCCGFSQETLQHSLVEPTRSFHDTFHWKKERKWLIKRLISLKANSPTTHHYEQTCHRFLLFPLMGISTEHRYETCSLPEKCCLHILQITRCTWQWKWREILKKQILKGFSKSMSWCFLSCYPSASFQHRPPSSPHSQNLHVSLLGDLQTEEKRGWKVWLREWW